MSAARHVLQVLRDQGGAWLPVRSEKASKTDCDIVFAGLRGGRTQYLPSLYAVWECHLASLDQADWMDAIIEMIRTMRRNDE